MEISLVIPNYNGRRLLEKNLPAVLRACSGAEIIVVDDASTDDSVAFLKKNYPQIRVLVHPRNLRFAAVCNSGVEAAKGKIVVLLNTDVVPENSFLKPLLAPFADPQVFSVGCREKDMVDGRVILSGRAEGEFRRGFLVHRRAKNQTKADTLWTTGGSMAVDRQKWQELGGMDTLFRPAYWEDIDLSWRARRRGWKTLFEPRAEVFHHHESTNLAAFGHPKMKVFAYKNQFLFVWKNGDAGMILRHLLWLPYHLLTTARRSDWLFWRGLTLALKQLPEVVKLRAK